MSYGMLYHDDIFVQIGREFNNHAYVSSQEYCSTKSLMYDIRKSNLILQNIYLNGSMSENIFCTIRKAIL